MELVLKKHCHCLAIVQLAKTISWLRFGNCKTFFLNWTKTEQVSENEERHKQGQRGDRQRLQRGNWLTPRPTTSSTRRLTARPSTSSTRRPTDSEAKTKSEINCLCNEETDNNRHRDARMQRQRCRCSTTERTTADKVVRRTVVHAVKSMCDTIDV